MNNKRVDNVRAETYFISCICALIILCKAKNNEPVIKWSHLIKWFGNRKYFAVLGVERLLRTGKVYHYYDDTLEIGRGYLRDLRIVMWIIVIVQAMGFGGTVAGGVYMFLR